MAPFPPAFIHHCSHWPHFFWSAQDQKVEAGTSSQSPPPPPPLLLLLLEEAGEDEGEEAAAGALCPALPDPLTELISAESAGLVILNCTLVGIFPNCPAEAKTPYEVTVSPSAPTMLTSRG